MHPDSSSDDAHSDTGLQYSTTSSEDSEPEIIKSKQDRSNPKGSRKRKYIKEAYDSSSSSEDERIVRTSKKRRERSPEDALDHVKPKKTSDIDSGDETEERTGTPVKKHKKTLDISSGSETDERSVTLAKTKTNRLQSRKKDSDSSDVSTKSKDSDSSDVSTKSNDSIRFVAEKHNGSKMQKQNVQDNEEDASDALKKLSSAENSVEELENEQKQTKEARTFTLSDSSDDSLSTDEKSTSVRQKERLQSYGSDSEESSTSHDLIKTSKEIKKRKSGGNKAKNKAKKDSVSREKTTDPKIERLKKYLRVAGLRVRSYEKLWEGCKTKKAKVEKLLQMLNDAGLKGKPTLQKCKKLHAKRERKEEVASLDIGNIITSDKGRPKRNTRSLYLNPHETAPAIKKPVEVKDNLFSRIKSFVDSEESD